MLKIIKKLKANPLANKIINKFMFVHNLYTIHKIKKLLNSKSTIDETIVSSYKLYLWEQYKDQKVLKNSLLKQDETNAKLNVQLKQSSSKSLTISNNIKKSSESSEHCSKINFLYVAASCLPFHISGYTTRTHEILKSIQALANKVDLENFNLFVLTRAGYPWDRKDSLINLNSITSNEIPLSTNSSILNLSDFIEPNNNNLQEKHEQSNLELINSLNLEIIKFQYNETQLLMRSTLDHISYDHLKFPKNNKLTAIYTEQASKEFEKYIIQNNISCVHAASNHVNALPALVAAKRLGIPFQYEIRGIWELTRISRFPEFKYSHLFKLALDLEAIVAKNADRVFVISEQLSQYIQKNWKIDPKKISKLPNCVSFQNLRKANDDVNNQKTEINLERDHIPTDSLSLSNSKANQLKTSVVTIGYAGSLIIYEGLQTLIKALYVLVNNNKTLDLYKTNQDHLTFHLEIIGEGEYRKELEDLVTKLELSSYVTFLGRLTPEEVKIKQQQFDLVCIPREPFEVCKLVPPIKLVEAMSNAKSVIVPNLPVFHDELHIDHDPHGCFFFESGNDIHLAHILNEILLNVKRSPNYLKEQGKIAQQYVYKHRRWEQFVPKIINCLSNYNLDGIHNIFDEESYRNRSNVEDSNNTSIDKATHSTSIERATHSTSNIEAPHNKEEN